MNYIPYGDPPPMQIQEGWQQYLQQANPNYQQLKVLGDILSEVAELNQRAKQTNELLDAMIDLLPIVPRPEQPKKKGKK